LQIVNLQYIDFPSIYRSFSNKYHQNEQRNWENKEILPKRLQEGHIDYFCLLGCVVVSGLSWPGSGLEVAMRWRVLGSGREPAAGSLPSCGEWLLILRKELRGWIK
jgi:hypothetical protein